MYMLILQVVIVQHLYLIFEISVVFLKEPQRLHFLGTMAGLSMTDGNHLRRNKRSLKIGVAASDSDAATPIFRLLCGFFFAMLIHLGTDFVNQFSDNTTVITIYLY